VVERCDVLAVGAHPDDVELGCGGTLARLAAAGRRVGVLDLTAGELATRGTPAERAREAAAAARALGVAWRHALDLPDGGLDSRDSAQRRAVVAVLRQATPTAVFFPHWLDPHPDHAAASRLVQEACFLAGIPRWQEDLRGPHRPRLLLAYPGPRQLLTPHLVVDVTATAAAKREALAAHASQFDPAAGAPTHLATGHFLVAVEGRDRAAGNTVGCEVGEGFVAVGPLSGDAIAWLLGEGPCGSA